MVGASYSPSDQCSCRPAWPNTTALEVIAQAGDPTPDCFPPAVHTNIQQKTDEHHHLEAAIWTSWRQGRELPTHLAVVIKDAAEIEEACRTKVGGYLLRLACAGDVLHLGTVHYPQIS